MHRHYTHADWALLPRGQLSKRPDIQFRTKIELAVSCHENLLDGLAFLLMLLPVFVLAFLIAIPNALAGPALHEGITLLATRRTQLGWNLILLVLVIFGFSFVGFTERNRTELLSNRRCSVLFTC